MAFTNHREHYLTLTHPCTTDVRGKNVRTASSIHVSSTSKALLEQFGTFRVTLRGAVHIKVRLGSVWFG